jgi:hypothetical protein
VILRHLVGRENVAPDGRIVDPRDVRHGVIAGRRVAALAGPIDPSTHLNLDFTAHVLSDAVVVERLQIGAAVLLDGDVFLHAPVDRAAFAHLGWVDVGARRSDWQLVLRRR